MLAAGFEMATLSSICYHVHDGGFFTTLLSDQTLYGKYGGEKGKPAGPYQPIFHGFYNIDACEQSPVIIHYRFPLQFMQSRLMELTLPTVTLTTKLVTEEPTVLVFSSQPKTILKNTSKYLFTF